VKKVSLKLSVLLLVLLFVFGGAINAQGLNPMMQFCGDLSEADCTLLTSAQTAMHDIHSASTNFDMSLSVSNIPQMPFDNLAFQLTGAGAFSVDPAAMEALKAVQSDPSAFMDPTASFAMIEDLLGDVAGDLSVTLTLPPELVAMANSMNSDSGVTIPDTISLDLRLVDSIGYVNLADIAALAPENSGVPAGWIGVDLAALVEQMSGMVSSMGDMSANMDTSAMQDYIAAFQDPEVLAEFLTVERVDDSEVMGQTVAVFHFTFDYAALFTSDVFRNMMAAQMEMMSSMNEDAEVPSEADMDEAMNMVATMMEGIELDIYESVGLDDNYIHSTSITMNWDMTDFMATMNEMSDATSTPMEGPAPVFNFSMTVENSNFNGDVNIVAPEDATIIPLGDAMKAPSST
jgi:hypothetical protein